MKKMLMKVFALLTILALALGSFAVLAEEAAPQPAPVVEEAPAPQPGPMSILWTKKVEILC